jgi:hypothetical protein
MSVSVGTVSISGGTMSVSVGTVSISRGTVSASGGTSPELSPQVEQLYLKQQVMYSTYLLFSNGLPVCVKNTVHVPVFS